MAMLEARIRRLLHSSVSRLKSGQLAKQIISAATTGMAKPMKKNTPATKTKTSKTRATVLSLNNGFTNCLCKANRGNHLPQAARWPFLLIFTANAGCISAFAIID